MLRNKATLKALKDYIDKIVRGKKKTILKNNEIKIPKRPLRN